jgi:hypothetical protein
MEYKALTRHKIFVRNSSRPQKKTKNKKQKQKKKQKNKKERKRRKEKKEKVPKPVCSLTTEIAELHNQE